MKEKPRARALNRQHDRMPLGFGNIYASAGDHIGHFYRTNDEEMSVLVSFLETGLQGQDKCVCLMNSGRKCQELQDKLKADGINVGNAISSGQLIISEGQSDPQKLRAMLSQVLQEIPSQFSLLRWVGVMSWALQKVPTTEKLMEWESHCNVVEDPAVIFLCQYELPAFSGSVVMDAMKTHPLCIVGNVVHQNPYYEKPEVYLEQLRGREVTALAG